MNQPPLLLLVDGDKNFAEIATAQLKAAGFEVEVARTSQEAQDMALKLKPDLILLDIYVSVAFHGMDTAFALKQNPSTRNLRIAFLSSVKDPWPGIVGEKRDVSRDLGMEDFIDKTEDFALIAEKIRKIISKPVSSFPSVIPIAPAVSTVISVAPTSAKAIANESACITSADAAPLPPVSSLPPKA